MTPVRLQLSRRKGFNRQAASRAANGLAAVTVARPGKWGNPFRIGTHGNAAQCVARYRRWLAEPDQAPLRARVVDELAGKNLACWCPPTGPCHGDVLLAVAADNSQDAAMHVIQLLLPLYDNDGHAFPDSVMAAIHERLVAKFGGVTAFSRTPAQGIWSHRGERIRDDVILVEVMAKTLDRDWWADFRRQLEKQLRQQTVVIRAQESSLL